MAAKYYQKIKKFCKSKHARTIKIFLRRENKKREFANDQYIKFFIENELSEEANNKKHKYVHSLYSNLSKDKKGKKT